MATTSEILHAENVEKLVDKLQKFKFKEGKKNNKGFQRRVVYQKYEELNSLLKKLDKENNPTN